MRAGVLVLIAAVVLAAAQTTPTPEQVHIALTVDLTVIHAAWVLQVPIETAPDGFCQYGPTPGGPYPSMANATTHTYDAGGFNGTIYGADMSGLILSNMYFYTCGAEGNMSPEFSFRTAPPLGTLSTIKVLAFGDMGASTPETDLGRDSAFAQKAMAAEIAAGDVDLLLSVGDNSYADDYNLPNSPIEDRFYREMEPCMANTPYMMAVGNHEIQFDFAAHLNRTLMPVMGDGPLQRFYYSINYGPMHVVFFSTEQDVSPGSEQWDFINADLAAVNRSQTPWVIAISHHPLYCSDLLFALSRCGTEAAAFRAALESTFHKYAVDVYMCGHNHMYERSWPIVNGTVTAKDYTDPKATIYIVNGAAGNREGTEILWEPDVSFRAFHSTGFDTGYLRMYVNATALHGEYVDAVTTKLTDTFTITKS